MCSHTAFLISLSHWLTPKQDLGRADSSGNVLFFVVLVFAKFSIKSVQQAKKPASPLCSPPPFFSKFLLFGIFLYLYSLTLRVHTKIFENVFPWKGLIGIVHNF